MDGFLQRMSTGLMGESPVPALNLPKQGGPPASNYREAAPPSDEELERAAYAALQSADMEYVRRFLAMEVPTVTSTVMDKMEAELDLETGMLRHLKKKVLAIVQAIVKTIPSQSELERAARAALQDADIEAVKRTLNMGVVKSTVMDKMEAELDLDSGALRGLKAQVLAALQTLVELKAWPGPAKAAGPARLSVFRELTIGPAAAPSPVTVSS